MRKGNIDDKYKQRSEIKEIYYKEDNVLLISLEKNNVEQEKLMQKAFIKAGLKRKWK